MPVIQFTKADILKSANLENETWYSFRIAQVKGPQPNANKDGLNLVFIFMLKDHSAELDGKEIEHTVSLQSKGKDYKSMMIPIVAAAKAVSIESLPKEGFALDTDEIIGKDLDAKYVLEQYQGRLIGKLDGFLPYKAAASKGSSY